MQNISEELKDLFKTDRLPFRDEKLYKNLRMVFDGFTIDNERISQESMTLTDSLCSGDELVFGSAESAELKITVANVENSIVGSLFTLYLDVYEDSGTVHTMQLGVFRVKSAVRKDDLWFRELTCYDRMNDLDIDVKAWYDGLAFPIKMKDFRDSFCAYVGIEQEEVSLVNDDIMIQKTADVQTLTGRDVMRSIGEVNAAFPHIRQSGKLSYVTLNTIGLYPAETLYPAEDLYPAEATDTVPAASYESIKYEDYAVEAITGIRIRETDEDLGASVGTSDNSYIVTGNFLLYGKSAEELKEIAANMFEACKEKIYVPFESDGVGLPYVEVGDSLSNMTDQSAVESFVFSLTLSGIQALVSEFSAKGNQYRENTAPLVTQIEQLNGKYFKLVADTDGLHAEIADTKEGLTTQIETVAGEFSVALSGVTSDLDAAKEEFSTEITAMQGSLDLKVSVGNVSSQLSLETDQVTITGNRLVVESSNFGVDADGNATFTGMIKSGEIYASGSLYMYLPGSGSSLWSRPSSYTPVLQLVSSLGPLTSGYLYVGCDSSHNASLSVYANGGKVATTNDLSGYAESSFGTLSYPTISGAFNKVERDGNSCAQCNDGSNLASASYVRNQVSSDARLKIITGEPREDLLEALKDVEVVQFQYKPGSVISDNDDGRQRFGITAQQAREAFTKHGYDDATFSFIRHQEPAPYSAPYIPDGDELKPDYMQLIPVLLYWCQQLSKKIDQLEGKA